MQKLSKKRLCRPSQLCLIYGSYAVLCHLVLIVLHILFYQQGTSGSVLGHLFAPWVEHSLMSLVLVIGGTAAFDILGL